MSEIFYLVNRSRNNEKSENLGQADEWDFKEEILKLGWSLSDRIIAKGDNGTKYKWEDEKEPLDEVQSTYEQIILITGSRDWTDSVMIKNALLSYSKKKVLLIHGDCKGADKISGHAAKELNFTIKSAPANWEKYQKAAGPIRNKEMVQEALEYKKQGIPTCVLAFHDCLEKSKGTLNCVTEAKKQGLEVIVHSHTQSNATKNIDVKQAQTPLDVFKNKLYTLWPWAKNVSLQLDKEKLNTFYEDTYGFGDDDWTRRLIDGTDEDELQRQVFAVLVCLEFSFDGSSKKRPSLWRFWRKLHKEVVCPAFIGKTAINLHEQYINWPIKTFKLEDAEGLIRVIWHKVYDTDQTSAEENWILDHFYAWAIYDREHSKMDKEEIKTSNPINKPKEKKLDEIKEPPKLTNKEGPKTFIPKAPIAVKPMTHLAKSSKKTKTKSKDK